MELIEAKKLYLRARKAYYAGAELMTDAKFDKLEAAIAKVEPQWEPLHTTGIKVGKKKARKLQHAMPSLNKVTTDKPEAVVRWVAKQNVGIVIMPKVDGASYELVYNEGKPVSLATRGDGVTGEDVSHFLPYLDLPTTIRHKGKLVIRTEIAMDRKTFDKKWRGAFKSDRNLASGLFNRQDVHAAIKDMSVVCLRVLNLDAPLSKQFEFLLKQGFVTVPWAVRVKDKVTVERLSQNLKSLHSTYAYRIDGLVLHSDAAKLIETSDKPDFAVAFKENDAAGQLTTITAITWEASKHGFLIPTAQVKPVEFDGATVTNITLNNAGWVKEHGLGVGAKVRIVRSGDIIPKIIEVVKPVAVFTLPSKKEHGNYAWDDNDTHLVLEDVGASDEAAINQMRQFYTALDIDHIGPGHIRKLVEKQYRTTEDAATIQQQAYVDCGIPEKIAIKICDQLAQLQADGIPLPLLVKASCLFERGIGERRIQKLLDEGEFTYLMRSKKLDFDRIAMTLGGTVAAAAICDKWPAFQKWLANTGLNVQKPKKAAAVKLTSKKLEGVGVTWTGYRDFEQQLLVAAHGGTVESFGGKTTVLLYRAEGRSSTKVEKAEAKGIKCLRWEQFVKAYKLI